MLEIFDDMFAAKKNVYTKPFANQLVRSRSLVALSVSLDIEELTKSRTKKDR